MSANVCSCSRPITDHAYLCRECSGTLEKHLAELPALADDLETTRTRQSRTGGRGIGIVVRDAERPVPWDDRAARVANRLRTSLVSWVRLCEDWRVTPEGPACRMCAHPSCGAIRTTRPPENTVQAMSRYLLGALPALRHRPEVTECADEMHAAVVAVESVIDRRPELTFYGPCGSVEYLDGAPDPASVPCPADLYGPEKASELVCESCATKHRVDDVRAYLLEQAHDRLATPVVLSRFLTAYGVALTDERIRKWVERGQLVAHGTDASGKAVYRISEVIDLLAKMNERKRAS